MLHSKSRKKVKDFASMAKREETELFITVFPKISVRRPFWFRKITTHLRILAHVNIQCPDDRYPKLKIRISELILDK
jgi:hypothetical protein